MKQNLQKIEIFSSIFSKKLFILLAAVIIKIFWVSGTLINY